MDKNSTKAFCNRENVYSTQWSYEKQESKSDKANNLEHV